MSERERLEIRIRALQEAREIVEREDRQPCFCEWCGSEVEAPLDTSPVVAHPAVWNATRIHGDGG